MTSATHPFIERLRAAGLITDQPRAVPAYDGPSAPPGDPRARRYAEAALRGEADAVATAPEGTRNDTLNRASWKLGQLVEAGHLNGQEVVDTLTIAAGQAGLGLSEIARTVPRAVRQGGAQPRIIPPATSDLIPAAYTIDPATLTDEQRDELSTVIAERFPRLDWQALWADDTEEDWIVEPLLAVGRAVVLYSPPKVGKSLLMLEVAAGIATGGTVLGEQTTRRRVLYVDFENDPRGDIRTRLQAMGYDWPQLDNLIVLSYPTMAALDSEVGGAELMAAAKHYEADVIVIDTLSRAVAGEENSNDTYLAFYRHTVLKCKQAGISMIRLDHSGKDVERGMRGASAKESDVDAIWKLARIDELQFSLQCTHHRMQVSDTDLLLIRENLPHLHHTLDTSGRRAAFDAKVQDVLAALESAGLPSGAGRSQARQALRSTGVAAKTSVIEAALKIRKGSIWDEQEGLK